MKIIYSKIIPPSGYKAICLWPFIFVRKKARKRFNKYNRLHEYLHGEQEKEMILVFFLFWYGFEFLVKLCYYRKWKKAYYNISFEREAYKNQRNEEYLDKRKHYSWIKYLRL